MSEAEAPRTTSSVEYVVSEITRHKRGAALAGTFLIILLAGVGYGLYRFITRPEPVAAPYQTTKMTRLTATGTAKHMAISPDGKYVAYAEKDSKQESLRVKQVATGSNVQIVPPADVNYWGLTFSNDSNYVYYVRNDKSNPTFMLYQVPALGGVSKELIEHIDSVVTFSPDGKRFAFVRGYPERRETALMVANADGTGERTLATRKRPDSFNWEGLVRIAWSPDGKIIACPASSTDADGRYSNVVGVQVEDGSEKPLTAQRWRGVLQVAWLSGGSGLAMIAADEGATSAQLWHLSYPSGEARRITNDLNSYRDVSLTADSSALVTVQTNQASNIWLAPRADLSRARPITSGTKDGASGLAWTPDGKIVYQSDASGKSDIWIMNADGTGRRQLTHDGENYSPTVAPDGHYIVFWSVRASQTVASVWRMNIDGGNPKQLTQGQQPRFSPDGQWVVYASSVSGRLTLSKVSIHGGDPVQLIDTNSNFPVISPDGKLIACYYWDGRVNPSLGVMIFPFAGGPPTKRFNIRTSSGGSGLHWTPDGRALLYIDNHLSNIWSQPIDGGNPVQMTDFQSDQIFKFDYSPDGKWLAVARGRVTEDVVMIMDAR